MPRQNVLPNNHSLGELHPHVLTMEHSSSLSVLKASLDGGPDNRPSQIYAHELMHWFDIVGTHWGQDYLDEVFSVFDLIDHHGERIDLIFNEVLRTHDADRAILFPSYFKYVAKNALHGSPSDPWRIDFTVGARYDPYGRVDDLSPIFFVRFSKSGNDVARQPMTVGTLLELRATWAEHHAYILWRKNLSPEERVVSDKLYEQSFNPQLYDPQFTTYTASAHVFSKMSGIAESTLVFEYAAELADLYLCASPSLLTQVDMSVLGDSLPIERLVGFQMMADRGVAFATLCFWLKKTDPAKSIRERFDEALKLAKLPSQNEIYLEAISAFRVRSPRPLKNSLLAAIRTKLIAAGRTLAFARVSQAGRYSAKDWKVLPSPMVCTSDNQQAWFGQPILTVEEHEFLHHLDTLFREATISALRAARGLEINEGDYVY